MNENKSLPTLVDPDPSQNRRHWQEAAAIICAGIGVMFALALLTYTPADLPGWIPFGQAEEGARSGEGTQNWVGPAGALIAGVCYFLIGMASYLIPVLIIWLGGSIWLEKRLCNLRTLTAAGALLLSAACLIEFQPFLLDDAVAAYNLPDSRGGLSGLWVGRYATKGTIGSAGGIALMTLICFVSAVFVSGSHPFHLNSALRRALAERARRKSEQRVSSARYPSQPPATEVAVFCEDEDPGEEPILVTPIDDGEEEPMAANPVEAVVHPADAAAFASGAAVPPPAPQNPRPRPDSAAPPPVPPRPTYRPKVNDTNRARPGAALGSIAANFSPHSEESPFADYQLPELNLLNDAVEEESPLADQAELFESQQIIIDTLKTFGLEVSPGDITRGPTVTRYEIYPSEGMRVKQIAALEADIARATRAESINILAPIPGKDTVGVEIANHKKVLVPLRKLLEQPEFVDTKLDLPIALGKDVYGKTIVADLAAMPHLLVAGATGSGKSVCINSIIASLLFRFSPDQLRIIMIDPKVVEMQVYHTLPHLAVPVVTDPKKVLLALQWCINEMERRYELFARYGCRKLEEYNKLGSQPFHPGKPKPGDPDQMQFDDMLLSDPSWEEAAPRYPNNRRQAKQHPKENNDPDFLPFVVVIIDELADLMQTAPANVETAINRLCQKARAAGIHLIVATQSPRVDVVTGLIKANIPARLAFQVSSSTDSRVILDKSGAEKLVGKGDMLFQPPDSPLTVRAQGAFLTDSEVQDVVDHCSHQAEPIFEPGVQRALQGEADAGPEEVSLADEETLARCIDVIVADGKASTSFLQRRLRLGYNRAARMMDLLEERGIVGPGDGAKPREILIPLEEDPQEEEQPAAAEPASE